MPRNKVKESISNIGEAVNKDLTLSVEDLAKQYNIPQILVMVQTEMRKVLEYYVELREVMTKFVPAFNNMSLKFNNPDNGFIVMQNKINELENRIKILETNKL